MKVPLSWIKEYVDINLSLVELARVLTYAGLEVDEVHVLGLPLPEGSQHETKFTGLAWERDKIVVGAVLELMPHPDADRLVLCRLDDGEQIHTVLTGAPSLVAMKNAGILPKPLKVAYARENALLYDGHSPGQDLMRLKRTKIRGVVSYSMVCSEKELGLSEEAEDIMYFDDDAPTGMPLADYIGDAVFEINIAPNIARDANMVGVAREIAAITNTKLRFPDISVKAEGPEMNKMVHIVIEEPKVNPRFIFGLVQNIEIKPSPRYVQRRLQMAGMRPINNIVDVTNYVMLEIGEPLHAFDYDVLVQRAGGRVPTITTRLAKKGETLMTLDNVERVLDDFTVLIYDEKSSLSLAGVMGGLESEVTENTRSVLLEAAAWNYVNTRKTSVAHKLISEAAYRFIRGVHPSVAERGIKRALELMRQWSGGVVAKGLADNYPLPVRDPVVEVSPEDARRLLGIHLSAQEIADILQRLEFKTVIDGDTVQVTCPDHRLDIGEGVVGRADIMEEVARIYGYDRIPEIQLSETLPPQRGNPSLELEERVRDLLVRCGLQELITYRMTSPAREARLLPKSQQVELPYVWLENPISSERTVMRRSLLASVLESMERNARSHPRMALFEIGPVFLPLEHFDAATGTFCKEPPRLAIVLSGERVLPHWQPADTSAMDFFDLKGILEALLDELHINSVRFEPAQHPSYHPGKCARIWIAGEHAKPDGSAKVSGFYELGWMGEIHPLIRNNFEELPDAPILAAELELDVLRANTPEAFNIKAVPAFPPVLEDLAFVVDENIPAAQIAELIQQTGGDMVCAVRLFDLYRGEKIGSGKKSMAFSITYQSLERTLTDEAVAKVRTRIINRLEKEIGAVLRK